MAAESRIERPVRRGRIDDGGGDGGDEGEKLYYHLTLLAETTTGYRNLLKLSTRGLPGGLLLQAADRLGAAGPLPRGRHRHDRVPRRGGPPGPAAGRRRGGVRHRGPAPGHLRAGQPVRRAAGPRPREAAQDQPPAARHRPPDRGAPARHQRQPLHHAGRTPSPTTPCCACRPARRWTTRSGSSSRATSTT